MSLLEFKDAIVNPLKTTIEQHKSVTLAQFSSRDDLTKQWDRAEGMVMSLNHIESSSDGRKYMGTREAIQTILYTEQLSLFSGSAH